MELRLIVLAAILGLSFATSNGTKPIVKQKEAIGKGYGDVPPSNNVYGVPQPPQNYGLPQPYGPPPVHHNNMQAYGPPNSPPYGPEKPFYGSAPVNNGYGAEYNNNNNYAGQYQAGNSGGYGSPHHYDGYNVPQNYGQQQAYYPDQSSYPDHGPFYIPKNYNYDSHYCSVHGSFLLAHSKDDNYGKENSKSPYASGSGSDNSNNNNNYGSNNYGENGYESTPSNTYAKSRYYTRQYCRFSAASSNKACNFCCKIVARSSNTSPDDIISAIFAFDPLNPPGNGAGTDYEIDGLNDQSKSIYQCVCCAPKHNYKK